MSPSRASDAGPDCVLECPICGRRDCNMIRSCAQCGNTVCDQCPGVLHVGKNCEDLLCARCAQILIDRITEEDRNDDEPECECRFAGDQADASGCRQHGGGR